ncbi:rod shape-determining protein MreC [Solimonas terrae]|uniref:Cell shape-determining protein MreC n=1 Tax=Solimonas terrae TaxID=1396819 RepID=A0A6M2BXV0_9GAMM|nr:rod shape-determining protein MreC [Solimonas terrae]NGY06729.1 rod shape-determining protein MreC [Solimonas terrae]
MNSLHDSYHRPLFPRGPGLGLRTLLLIAVSLTLIFNDMRGDSLKAARAWTAWSLTPVIWLASLPVRFVDMARGIDTSSHIEQQNAELKQQQFVLSARLSKMDALEAENRRLRELLASSAQLTDQVLVAEIIAVNQDPYRHQITLNRGSRDGIYRGQALVDAYGVMGQVIDVAPNTCKALLVTDPDHGIPVEINRTGLQTIAVGLGDERGLRLPFLPSNADIKNGDLLVSSSLGGRFPAGYPVGKVYDVKPVAGEHFMEAYAYPAARLNQGRQALLVWNRGVESDADAAVAAETAADQDQPQAARPAPVATGKPPAASKPEPAKPAAAPAATPARTPARTPHESAPTPATPAVGKPKP